MNKRIATLLLPGLLLIFAGGPAAFAKQSPSSQQPASQQATGGPHLEELVRISKERADRSRLESMGPVTALMALLELPYEQSPEKVESTIQEILKYKDVATRALIQGLRAPAGAPRGSNSARALAKSADPAIVSELESELANAKPETRSRIAWVLGRHPGDRTPALIQKLFMDSDTDVVGAAALAASQLKLKDFATPIAEKLEKAQPSLAKNLLAALGELEDPKVTAQILTFLETPIAQECIGALASPVRSLHSKELLLPSLKALMKWKGSNEDNLKLVQAVGSVITANERDAMNLLKRLLSEVSASREVQEEAAYALHFAKDPTAKNFLLQDVNDRLRENPESDKLIKKRARIYLKLKLYRESVRDYEDLRRIAKNNKSNFNIDPDLWVEMARAYAGGKTYQSAADCLRNAMSTGMHAKIFRDHEEFADMRKQTKYLPLFENND
ncbi:MAG: hypothetical protein HY286_05705 [Planctomycetes bacterium]|nr:hypothetical protein [Planctomycetota bacterium]